ncbi:ABC transporter permease [Phenylobacterium sp.]|jgi:putative ABC transport system permease protein|uniref:ABC transporter permease n=1 Tax=Phenylobacterium sp. TaxID=1871053 RepID=UPI002F9590A2
MSLALATLLYEWRRYTAAMVALAFSGLLILAQIGMFTGLVRGITATIDRSRADIMVLGPKSDSLINSGPGSGVPMRVRPQLYMHPEVVEVAPLMGNGAMWANVPEPGKKRKTDFVQIWTVDPRPGSVSLPTDYSEQTRRALLEPMAIAVDKSSLKKLGVGLNDSATINGKTVKVRALLEGYASMDQTSVVMSNDSYRLLGLSRRGSDNAPMLVRIKDPARADGVRDKLNAGAKGAYRAFTRQELSKANEAAILKEQIIGVFLTFSVVLGFLIGIGITSQTLRGAILASIKEFASLRALGVSLSSLSLIVMELSFWVGVAGLGVTAVLTLGVYLLANNSGLPMGFPLPWLVGVTIMLLAIAMASGLLALGILKKSQPADLLR